MTTSCKSSNLGVSFNIYFQQMIYLIFPNLKPKASIQATIHLTSTIPHPLFCQTIMGNRTNTGGGKILLCINAKHLQFHITKTPRAVEKNWIMKERGQRVMEKPNWPTCDEVSTVLIIVYNGRTKPSFLRVSYLLLKSAFPSHNQNYSRASAVTVFDFIEQRRTGVEWIS